jgi:predicted phosphodiesterase
MIRIFSISDLHVDYKQNQDWVKNLSNQDYKNDYLIIAGDISDNPLRFTKTITTLSDKFKGLFFVPGNHDLWIRKDELKDSIEKFNLLMDICNETGVFTKSEIITKDSDSDNIIIQPLLAWYTKPEEGNDSLYLAKEGDDPTLSMWVDNRAIKWPDLNGCSNVAEYYIKMNDLKLAKTPHSVVISFSHFLPRQELIFGINGPPPKNSGFIDPLPKFNFSRVAGTSQLEKQIREINSQIHIYGHQHRNRFRNIDGVFYIAHGLGYPKERQWANINDKDYFPRLIWSSENGSQHGEIN